MWWTTSSQGWWRRALPHVSRLTCQSHDKPHLVLARMCKLCPVIWSLGWSHRAVASALFIEGDVEGVKEWRVILITAEGNDFDPACPPFENAALLLHSAHTHTGCLPCALSILFSFAVETMLFFPTATLHMQKMETPFDRLRLNGL